MSGIIEEQGGDASSVEDTGIKFLAWGSTPDRLYTGSSDGVVKVWGMRASGGDPLVRNLLECHAPVSCGAFSPDFSKLVVGDASGRVFVLTIDDDEDEPLNKNGFTALRLPDGTVKTIRRLRPLTRHAEPPPPRTGDASGTAYLREETGRELAKRYLDSGELVIARNPVVGAVQGPNYAETGLYRRDVHLDGDPTKPLVAKYAREQRDNQLAIAKPDRLGKPVRDVKEDAARNMDIIETDEEELALDSLDPRLRAAIAHERANEADNNGLLYVDDEYMLWRD